jgi:carboxylesterase type B
VARYRPHALCHKARAEGQPIILIQVGYRLGALGFAASEALGQQQRSDEPCLGNYGFEDQRNALRWVHEHIRDFGGDAQNITAFGVSAGSASVHYHILTGDPMFDKAICMSGTGGTLGPLPLEQYQKAWDDLCQSVKLVGDSSEQQMATLRSMPVMDLIKHYSKAAMGPTADGRLLPRDWKFEQPLETRCRSLILGDTNIEGIILDGIAKRIQPEQLQQIVRDTMSIAHATKFYRYFGFTGSGQDWIPYRDSIRRFLGFTMFQYPNLRIAETFKTTSRGGQAYLYHFEESSPFAGPTLGVAYHGQCALYMYGVENDKLPPSSQRIADEMARTWIAFAHDHAPWTPYTEGCKFMRYGPKGVSSMMTLQEDETRKYDCVEWVREHQEVAVELARKLLGKN